MRTTQLKLASLVLEKQPNKTEKEIEKTYLVAAKKERISQSRLDNFSMQGLSRTYRYTIYNLGELADFDFTYFYDEKGKKYLVQSLQESLNRNEWTIEGVLANGI